MPTFGDDFAPQAVPANLSRFGQLLGGGQPAVERILRYGIVNLSRCQPDFTMVMGVISYHLEYKPHIEHPLSIIT